MSAGASRCAATVKLDTKLASNSEDKKPACSFSQIGNGLKMQKSFPFKCFVFRNRNILKITSD